MGAEVLRLLTSASVQGTERLGEMLGRGLFPGAVLALSGDLGAGKTTLVRGLARGLEVIDEVTSPSFTLMHEYRGRHPVFHFDAWMSGREAHFLEGGGVDYLAGGEGVAVVEWAEKVAAWLPRPHLGLTIDHLGPDRRGFTLRLVGAGVEGEPDAGRIEARLRALVAEIAPGGGLEERHESPRNPDLS